MSDGQRMTRSRNTCPNYLAVAILLVAAEPSAGQDEQAGSALSGAAKVLRISRTDTPPMLDGRIGDEVWERAAAIDDLLQYLPADHVEPSERTEVFVLYDDEYLYVGARMWDREPGEITARQMIHGQTQQWDDSFAVLLDPFNNKRTGYSFQVNPNGTRRDGVFETATDLNRSWEGIWHAEAQVDEQGWTAEIAIPFKTLNFDPNNADWGFNAYRRIARKQEQIAWESFNRQVNPGASGVLTGVSGIQQGAGLDIVPTLVTSTTRDYDAGTSDGNLEPALDVFYNFTPSLGGVLTLNTDFSAEDVDDRQVNLTRFSLFFPEKRDFFLRDVDIFSFGGLERNGIPFFSRRIGLSGTGQPVALDVGAKLSGRIGRWNVGVLDIKQDEFQGVDSSNLFVGRVAANVLEESSVGMIITDGDPRTNLDNSLIGVDFRYRNTSLPQGRTLEGEAWYQQSDTEGVVGDQSAWGVRVASPNRTGISGEIAFDRFDEAFNPALGFVNRSGVERSEFRLGYISRPTDHWARRVSHGAVLETFDRIAGGLESRSLFVELVEVETNSGDEFGLQFNRDREVLLEDFEIADGIVIPIGDYEFDRYGFEVSGASERAFAPSFEYTTGEFFNGDRVLMEAGLEWRPNRRLAFELEYEYNDIELPAGDFTVRLIALQADIAFNVRWSWLNLVQYDNESESVGINSRLRWNPRAGQDLFIVLNHGFDARGAFSGLHSTNSQLSIKYTQTFRL